MDLSSLLISPLHHGCFLVRGYTDFMYNLLTARSKKKIQKHEKSIPELSSGAP